VRGANKDEQKLLVYAFHFVKERGDVSERNNLLRYDQMRALY